MTQGKEEILNFKKLEVIRVSGDVDMANVLRAVLKRTVLSSKKNRYKTQQYTTAKQRLVKKGVQWFFRLCSRGTLEHNQTNCL